MNQPIAFGKYYLLERINVGGMAEVFKAKAFGVEGFERLVAVKRILPNIAEDEEFITMFIDEAKIAVQLQHANIAQIFDLGKVDDSYFIALEYVNGKDLRGIFDLLRKTSDGDKGREKMPMAQACYIVMQVCEGLDYAHNKRDGQGRDLNLVHRDVSPQNVLIGYEGEIKIVDFGIAKAAGKASKTQAGILKGKFGYMSPEQVRGLPVDRRSDIFALGIVLYELLTGERLFVGESDFSTLEKVRNVEILPPSSFNKKVPQELERIVLKALAKDVDDRYQNAIDLHDDLQAFLYSVGEFYSRKDLSAWMKKTFSGELEEESAKNAQYEKFEEPTPAPALAAGRGGTNARKKAGGSHVGKGPQGKGVSGQGGAGKAAGGQGLGWEEEELETQIFDKAPEDQDADDELHSGDILLTDQEGDDKTAIAAPPEVLEGAGMGAGYGAAGVTTRPMGGGPPPGLSAYRQSGQFPAMGTGPAAGASRFTPSGSPAALGANGAPPPGIGGPGSPFRQTLLGVGQNGMGIPGGGQPQSFAPQPLAGQTPFGGSSVGGLSLTGPQALPGAPYGGGAMSERAPLASFQQRQRKSPLGLTAAVTVLLVGGLVGLYLYSTRAGQLHIVVAPADATVAIDDKPIQGSPPLRLQRKPGSYDISVRREGYIRQDRQVEIRPGQSQEIQISLDPSPDTGFELTSEPTGMLVWMDGQPFIGVGGQQARTDFKAYPVIPGRHTLEIRGDDRFEEWKTEFYQDPGKTMTIRAALRRKGAPPPVAEGAAAPAAPLPIPSPAPVAPAPTREPAAQARNAPPRPARPAPVRQPAAQPRPAPAPKRVVATRSAPSAPQPAPSGGDCVASIGAKPWAKVSVDGREVGTTPIVDLKLPCGSHRVVLHNADLDVKKTESITLKAGEKFKKSFALIELD